jgi:hypothetical protein
MTENKDTKEDWVFVDDAPNHFHAEILRGLLEAQDIPVTMFEEAVGRVIPFTLGVPAMVQIFVPSKDQERAKEILENYYDKSYSDNDQPFDEIGSSEDET